jgi:hypothetical protein
MGGERKMRSIEIISSHYCFLCLNPSSSYTTGYKDLKGSNFVPKCKELEE